MRLVRRNGRFEELEIHTGTIVALVILLLSLLHWLGMPLPASEFLHLLLHVAGGV